MRSPFFATDRGMATATTTAFRHTERKPNCARTMVVISNIELDRMLLHSLATSTVKPGMVSMKPFCATGTPAAVNRIWAADVEPCCKSLTTLFNRNVGNGTIQNKKQSGKSNAFETRVPKQQTKAPIHHRT